VRLFILLFSVIWWAGCGSDATNVPSAGDIAGLTSEANQTQMYATQQIQMTATVSYSQGLPDRNVTEYVSWDSNDTDIATVTVYGVVGAGSVGGDINITASYDHFSSVNTINVIGLSTITVDCNETNLTLGQTVQLSATGTFEDNASFDISNKVVWTLYPPTDSNASIEQNGTLYTGDINGTLEVVVIRYDVNATASLLVAP